MENAVLILPTDEKAPKCHQYVNCNKMFEVQMEDFRRKACLMVGCHVLQMEDVTAYSRMVTRETIYIAYHSSVTQPRGQSSRYIEFLCDGTQ